MRPNFYLNRKLNLSIYNDFSEEVIPTKIDLYKKLETITNHIQYKCTSERNLTALPKANHH